MTRDAMVRGYACFDTSVGVCGIAWTALGVAGVWLPMMEGQALNSRLAARYPGVADDVPQATANAIDGVIRLLNGERLTLADIVLDVDGIPHFHRRVYEVTRAIPPGATRTYGDIARMLGATGSARAVGQALGKNPFPIVVPCHRVLAADGSLTGFSAPGGLATKRRLLAIEGVRFDAPPRLPGLDDDAADVE